MTHDEFLLLRTSMIVRAHVGNVEHAAKIVSMDHQRQTFALLFLLADGTMRIETRHRRSCRRVTQGVSVGRIL
jgi:hypothetical protein